MSTEESKSQVINPDQASSNDAQAQVSNNNSNLNIVTGVAVSIVNSNPIVNNIVNTIAPKEPVRIT